MKAVFKDAMVYRDGKMHKETLLFDGTSLSVFAGENIPCDTKIIYNTAVFPGFCDVHVHFREPGFSYKETVKTGSLAAARGGYTAVMTMPNLKPTPDSKENLQVELDAIERDACIKVYPYGTITVGEAGEVMSDMDGIANDVIGFSDDGRGVQSEEMMAAAMRKAKKLGKIIAAHCEDNALLHGGYIHDGEYAKKNGHRGICSESEYGPIIRDIELVKRTGCKYHVCHVSAKESVDAIRRAKADGVDITCEVGPHYLTMNDSMLLDEGRFKMNPPIRAEEDRVALVEGLLDGTIDMIATDHAPHSKEEKSKGLSGSVMGVVGLETAFAVLYTKLVLKGIMSLENLIELMSVSPRRRFGLTGDPGFTVFELSKEYEIDPSDFLTMGKATPFLGWRVKGTCLATVLDGRAAYISEKIK
ncbi:MAG: dihydroorotase [Clostridia bacterium]|nr:dihydroorotase [Clostridia bacterium]